jgi:o-succinylbenzoate---CoA ligase
MRDWLSARAVISPNKRAFYSIDDEYSLTYSELNFHVAQLCTYLAKRGVHYGDRIGVLLPNNGEYFIVTHAIIRLGAIIVPLNIRLTSREIDLQIEQTQCKLLIHSLWTADTVSQLILQECAPIGVHFHKRVGPAIFVVADGVLDSNKLVASVTGYPLPIEERYLDANLDLERPCAIIFTSGTTGVPKGAVLSYGNFFHSAMSSAYHLGVLPDDYWLCCLPLYHIGGLSIIVRACLYGISVNLTRDSHPVSLNAFLLSGDISLVSLVPTMLYRMLDELRADSVYPPRLRLILLGGAAASTELIGRAKLRNLPLAPTYGLSEACSQVATMHPEVIYQKPGSVGKPLLFTSVRIVDENGVQQPSGEYGEVVVSGPTVMSGYYGNPEATAKTLRNGELYTGDIGYLDTDGDLWLVQRRSDLIVSGGENVYPVEVEQVLQQHPAVSAACVVGIEHPEWGQQVAAAVVLRDNATLTDSELLAFSRERLAGYKQPRLIRFVTTLPQTASGKIQRRAVYDLLVAGEL